MVLCSFPVFLVFLFYYCIGWLLSFAILNGLFRYCEMPVGDRSYFVWLLHTKLAIVVNEYSWINNYNRYILWVIKGPCMCHLPNLIGNKWWWSHKNAELAINLILLSVWVFQLVNCKVLGRFLNSPPTPGHLASSLPLCLLPIMCKCGKHLCHILLNLNGHMRHDNHLTITHTKLEQSRGIFMIFGDFIGFVYSYLA